VAQSPIPVERGSSSPGIEQADAPCRKYCLFYIMQGRHAAPLKLYLTRAYVGLIVLKGSSFAQADRLTHDFGLVRI